MIRDEVLTAEEVEGKSNTELLSKHILELQADKGRLTDKNRELQHKVDVLQGYLDHDIEYDMDKKIQELEAQIEKMKCCENCQTVRDAEGNCYLKKDGKCKNKDKWELRR